VPTYSNARPNDAYLQELLGSGDILTVVAEVDGRVVAGLSAYILHKFEQERSEVYIYDLAVESRFAGKVSRGRSSRNKA